MIQFTRRRPWLTVTPEGLGPIPMLLDENDPRPGREQINEKYPYRGGWRPMEGPGWEGLWLLNPTTKVIQIPLYGNEPMFPIAEGKLRDETIYIYRHCWTDREGSAVTDLLVLIEQPGEPYVARSGHVVRLPSFELANLGATCPALPG